jgi:hypothetical protein
VASSPTPSTCSQILITSTSSLNSLIGLTSGFLPSLVLPGFNLSCVFLSHSTFVSPCRLQLGSRSRLLHLAVFFPRSEILVSVSVHVSSSPGLEIPTSVLPPRLENSHQSHVTYPHNFCFSFTFLLSSPAISYTCNTIDSDCKFSA